MSGAEQKPRLVDHRHVIKPFEQLLGPSSAFNMIALAVPEQAESASKPRAQRHITQDHLIEGAQIIGATTAVEALVNGAQTLSF